MLRALHHKRIKTRRTTKGKKEEEEQQQQQQQEQFHTADDVLAAWSDVDWRNTVALEAQNRTHERAKHLCLRTINSASILSEK